MLRWASILCFFFTGIRFWFNIVSDDVFLPLKYIKISKNGGIDLTLEVENVSFHRAKEHIASSSSEIFPSWSGSVAGRIYKVKSPSWGPRVAQSGPFGSGRGLRVLGSSPTSGSLLTARVCCSLSLCCSPCVCTLSFSLSFCLLSFLSFCQIHEIFKKKKNAALLNLKLPSAGPGTHLCLPHYLALQGLRYVWSKNEWCCDTHGRCDHILKEQLTPAQTQIPVELGRGYMVHIRGQRWGMCWCAVYWWTIVSSWAQGHASAWSSQDSPIINAQNTPSWEKCLCEYMEQKYFRWFLLWQKQLQLFHLDKRLWKFSSVCFMNWLKTQGQM